MSIHMASPKTSNAAFFVATVVEGPGDNAHFDYRVDANRTSSGDCSIKDGVANCSFDLVVSGSQITSGTATETATFQAIVVSSSTSLSLARVSHSFATVWRLTYGSYWIRWKAPGGEQCDSRRRICEHSPVV